jgi:hypothetical protein
VSSVRFTPCPPRKPNAQKDFEIGRISDKTNFRADFARTLPIFEKEKSASTFFAEALSASVLAPGFHPPVERSGITFAGR